MRFEPKTRQQLEDEEKKRLEESLLPKGTYDFEVFRAEEAVSKKGNDMIALGLRIFAPDGSVPFVNDWLLEAMAYKLRHFCETTGLLAKYDDGSLCAEDCKHAAGKVQLDIEKAKNNYGPKNVVKDYGAGPESDEMPSHKATKDPSEEDDIPF